MSTGTPNKPPLPAAARVSRPASQESVDLLTKKVDDLAVMMSRVLAIVVNLSTVPPTPSILSPSLPSLDTLTEMTRQVSREVYNACTKAASDKADYVEKESRAVVIGTVECEDRTEGLKRDEKLVEDLVAYCGSEDVKKSLSEGKMSFTRHPADRPPGSRPLKIKFESKALRDSFLSGIRSKPGRPPPLVAPSSFVRQDLTPTQLQLERDARKEAVKRNLEANQIVWGVRDYSLISYRTSRPLPPHYGSPRASRSHNPAADISSPGLASSSDALKTARTSTPPPSQSVSHVNMRTRRQ